MHLTQQVAYRVESLRESIIGDKIDTDALQQILNARAIEGWILKTTIKASIKGRMGPGGTGGVILIFERQMA